MIRPIVFGLAVGVPFGLAWGWLTGSAPGWGLFAGALLGTGVAAWEALMRRRLLANASEVDGEPVVLEGLANHLRRGESVGGRLILTDARLIFEPHPINVQEGSEERFVVEQRKRWLAQLGGRAPRDAA